LTNYKTRSSAIDALSAQVVDKTMEKIHAWYNNEIAHSTATFEFGLGVVVDRFITTCEERLQ